jgi:radical SAM superfamily enzyme YgiQ (UPF0313 family)
VDLGTFSLGVLAAAVRDLARITIMDGRGMSLPEIAAEVRRHRPTLIGITAMDILAAEPARALIGALRATAPADGPPIIMGGHGASGLPERMLEAGADAVVVGEGERTLADILEHGLRPGRPGVVMTVDGETVSGPPQEPIVPLDALNPPARDLMPEPALGIHMLETSRGCPHQCAFCETTRFHGTLWRPQSPSRVAGEVRRLVEEYDAWVILIADDNFTASPTRVKRICELLQALPLPATFIVAARADDLVRDPDLLPAMAETRMLRLQVGVETLDPASAALAGKPIAEEVYAEAFRRMRELGMFSIASLIVGLPGETPESRARAVDRCVAVLPDSAIFLPLQPMPGTPVADRTGVYTPDPAADADALRFTQAFWEHPTVRRNLETAARGDDVRALLAQSALREPPQRHEPLLLPLSP